MACKRRLGPMPRIALNVIAATMSMHPAIAPARKTIGMIEWLAVAVTELQMLAHSTTVQLLTLARPISS